MTQQKYDKAIMELIEAGKTKEQAKQIMDDEQFMLAIDDLATLGLFVTKGRQEQIDQERQAIIAWNLKKGVVTYDERGELVMTNEWRLRTLSLKHDLLYDQIGELEHEQKQIRDQIEELTTVMGEANKS